MQGFDNNLDTVKTKTTLFSRKRLYCVEILERCGEIQYGHAVPALDGFNVYGEHGILSSYGKDGEFPQGSSWGWARWKFIREPK